jgi:regulator of protease activity HflC (stomatin/prohibitin superfamily)
MAEIKIYPLMRHLRAEPTAHVLRYRKGSLLRQGPGLAFWFSPNSAAVVEVPLEDQDLPFLFHARSADFQELTVQGVITFRFADPELIARRVDFTVDLRTGEWTEAPLEQAGGLLVQMAQQYVIDELMALELRTILAAGVAPIRERITAGLTNESTLQELGIEIAAVRVAGLSAENDVQRALQQPTREAIQQRADEATFSRRALAVEKERAIAENELANKIELAVREENLVAQEGANERRRAEEQAAADTIAARATDQTERMAAKRRSDAVRELEAARLEAERVRADINAGLGAQVLVALAARELAGQLGKVEHLTITPELLTPLLGKLTAATPEA